MSTTQNTAAMNNDNLPTSMIQDMILGLVMSRSDFRHGMGLGSKGGEDVRTLMNELKGRMDEQNFNEFVKTLDRI